MEEKIGELKKDIEELDQLYKQATRTKVRGFISIETRKLSTELIRLQEKLKEDQEEEERKARSDKETTPSSPQAQATTKCFEVTLTKYGWADSWHVIKFYVDLPKVHTLPAEKIYCAFRENSFELTVRGLENRDYILVIKNLLDKINPKKCTWKVKTDMIIIEAVKVVGQTWNYVTLPEKWAAERKDIKTDDKEHSDGLMDIMRKMYQQGDDELKRTIAKAWTESQSKGPAF